MRLIDADALIEESESSGWDIDLKELRMILKYVPTIDAVPVVRCGECKNFSPRNLVNFCSRTGRTCENNDFCSYGAKMEDKPCG